MGQTRALKAGERAIEKAELNGSHFFPAGLGTQKRLEKMSLIYLADGDLEATHKGVTFIVPSGCLGPLTVKEDVKKDK